MPHALADVSHRQVAFEARGPQAQTALSVGCPLDLDIEEFPVGMCTRTLLGKADIVLWRTGAEYISHRGLALLRRLRLTIPRRSRA